MLSLNTARDLNMAAQPKWRKILYEHQGVPDHYVDETFLDELKKNCKLNLSFVIKRQKVIKKKRKKQRKCLGGTVPDPDCRRPSVSGSGNVSGCGNAEFRDISYGWLGVRQYTSMPCFMSVIGKQIKS